MFRKTKNSTPDKYLVFGLGNPGKRFVNTPHNIGRDFLEELRRSAGPTANWKKQVSLQAETAEIRLAGERLLLLRSLLFMNESGTTLAKAKNFYKIPLSKIIVIHDDSDLALGKIKLADPRSRSAGHHGIDSIFAQLKTKAIPRIKTGVRSLDSRLKADSFILNKFAAEQQTIVRHKVFPLLEKTVAALVTGNAA